MSTETTAFIFFILLLFCFSCIFLLLVAFIYKCFNTKTESEGEKISYTDANKGEEDPPANGQTDNSKDQEKAIVVEIMDVNTPVRPGILVQRRSKEALTISFENTGGLEAEAEAEEEDKAEVTHDAEDAGQEGDDLPKIVKDAPLAGENQKRPLKGVTFSREVIVVDLGKEYPTPQSYTREHKERK
ncbi:uncharacterized protein C2orf74 homolog [Dasypus novemcinctus]|uniref:uncharacterized protein C2orf74 homolog n=1 Tax=Dasypus novemcinctus TaxID=9361 RepID=UPI00062A6D41|nr:uncharacterized protein C2orf74 homolog [Dasypus novemcinctus]